MTTREQLKRAVGADRSDAGRGIAADPAPSLPERLYAARERKGVDLYRAERDTKIRARYLGALERGDYKELPGAVYTKGFLRNYALYLGLDPDEVLDHWRRERGEARDIAPVIAVPRPITAPRQGLTFSPSIVVFALLTAVITVDESTTNYTLRGTTLPGATVTIATPGDDPTQVTAGPDGDWTSDVDLRRGRNQFDISAVDPDTGKRSEDTIRRFITVPVPDLAIVAPTLTVDQPAEGTSFANGAIPVAGRATNAASVVVSATYVGPSTPPATEASATPAPPAVPSPVTLEVADDGSFSTPFELTAGRWTITVTAESPEGRTSAQTRNVSVVFSGVNLVVTIEGGRAWLKVWVDGVLDPDLGAAGSVIANGRTLTFTGEESVEVRSGSSGVTHFTLNGTPLGALGRAGIPETWLFAPPDPPVKTNRR